MTLLEIKSGNKTVFYSVDGSGKASLLLGGTKSVDALSVENLSRQGEPAEVGDNVRVTYDYNSETKQIIGEVITNRL